MNDARKTALPALILIFWAFTGLCAGQDKQAESGGTSKVAAIANGVEILTDAVVNSLYSDLETLDVKRRAFEVSYGEERYWLLRNRLDRLIFEQLLIAEAGASGQSEQQLLKTHVQAKVIEPKEEDIAKLYEEYKSRLGGKPLEEVRGELVSHHKNLQLETLSESYFKELKGKYPLVDHLGPLRLSMPYKGYPTTGPPEAPVVLMVFSDFECPACAKLAQTLDEIKHEYKNKVQLVYRQFPLERHEHASRAAEASLCAAEQDLFWQMHEQLFTEPIDLGDEALLNKAVLAGVDPQLFQTCFSSGRYRRQVRLDYYDGVIYGVRSTPALYINGRPIRENVNDKAQMKAVIEEELRASAK